jgi:hypothetical protein
MPKGKRGKRKPDPLEIRFHLRVRKDIAATLTAKRYNEVYRQWVLKGTVPDGFIVPDDAAEWRNKNRVLDIDQEWRTGNNVDAVNTMLLRSLPATKFTILSRRSRSRRP